MTKRELIKRELIKRGFTMIEMVVSIAIVVSLTLVFIVNYHTTNQRTDLTMAAQSLVADLYMAQNNALGLVQYNGQSPAGGWGLSFNTASSSYVLFADQNDNMSYDSTTEGNVNYGARVMAFAPGISITSLKLANGSSVSQANVTFLPPDPQTNIYSGGATSTALTIQLKEAVTNTVKTIQVNFLGLAEVTD